MRERAAMQWRPQGEVRRTLADALAQRPGYPAELAHRTGLDVGVVRTTLDNMRRAGQAVVQGPAPVPGANRPARVYAAAESAAAQAAGGLNWDLVDCWARGPATT